MSDILNNRSIDEKVAIFMIAAFLLIELANKTQYTQGDFHFHNIFFKEIKHEMPYFLTEENAPLAMAKKFRPLIIDFGRAKIIDEPISELYKQNKFREILGTICAAGCINGNKPGNLIMKRPWNYGWASGKQIVVGENDMENYKYEFKNTPNELCFLKNAYGNICYSLNLPQYKLVELNKNFDILMGTLLIAKEKTIIEIKKMRKLLASDINFKPVPIEPESNIPSEPIEPEPKILSEPKIIQRIPVRPEAERFDYTKRRWSWRPWTRKYNDNGSNKNATTAPKKSRFSKFMNFFSRGSAGGKSKKHLKRKKTLKNRRKKCRKFKTVS